MLNFLKYFNLLIAMIVCFSGLAQSQTDEYDPSSEPCSFVLKDSGKPYFKKWYDKVSSSGVGLVNDRYLTCEQAELDAQISKYPKLKLEVAALRKNLPDVIEPAVQFHDLLEPTGTAIGLTVLYQDQRETVEGIAFAYATATLKHGRKNSSIRVRQQRTAINSIQTWFARAPRKSASFPEARDKQYWAELIPKANSSFAKIKKQFGIISTPGSLEIFKAIDAKFKGA